MKFWVIDDVKYGSIDQVVERVGLDEGEEEFQSTVHLIRQMTDGDVLDLDTVEIICVESEELEEDM